jgi:hypothetical protein
MLILTTILAIGSGMHAFFRHKREGKEAVSAQRLIFGLYSAGFLAAVLIDFSQLLVSIQFGDHNGLSLYFGYATIVLLLSYGAVLMGVSRRLY